MAASRRVAVGLSDIRTVSEHYAASDLQPIGGDTSQRAGMRIAASSAINNCVGLIKADVTTLRLDAIVNAANTSLLGGGGVDGAIHRAAGPKLLAECRTIGGCPTGEARITAGYNLPASHVIHTVGPQYGDPSESARLLRSCYLETLGLAAQTDVRTLAFSAISTGIYGYPSQEAAMIACRAVREFLEGEQGAKIDRVVFVTFEPKDVDSYKHALPIYFPPE